MTDFFRPSTIGDVVRIMAEKRPVLVAGGTDLMIRMRNGLLPRAVMDISGVDALHGVGMHGSDLVIGALTTHAELEAAPAIREFVPALWQAVRMVGSPQIRNMGTIGGNIANASPSADTLPPLYVLDARVDVLSVSGRRTVPIAELFTGPKQTVLKPDEVIGWVRIPVSDERASIYQRLGTRAALSISKVGVAVAATLERTSDAVRLLNCRVALGAVAPTVIYARSAMQVLEGEPLSPELVRHAAGAAAQDARPIDDLRSTAIYRRTMVRVLTKRCLQGLAENPIVP